MTVLRLALAFVGAALAMFLTAAPAQAQATRTWVSGVGDDANPCSRTAPCKTFAGAISKTATGGEINCLDPGGYGAVTITKSIVIDCGWTHGSILAANTNGVIINATATSHITLRGLSINGAYTTTGNAIRFLAGGSLTVENLVIENFSGTGSNGTGILFNPGGASELFVRNTTITNSNLGILIQPAAGATGSARAYLDDVHVTNSATSGLNINSTGATNIAGSSAEVHNSSFAGGQNGILLTNPPATSITVVMVTDSRIFNNSVFGIRADGGSARARVGNSTITGNATGVSVINSGAIFTYGTNRLDFNSTDGTFAAPPLAQE